MDQSKLTACFDFRQVSIPQKLMELPVAAEDVDRKLQNLAERFLTIEPADEIRAGDIVRIALEVTDTQPAGVLHINVGKAFYDPDWETSLVGMTVGDPVVLPKRGQGRRGVIASVKRRCIPPVNDTLVQRMGDPSITTVAACRAAIETDLAGIAQQKKEPVLIQFVMKETAKASSYDDLTEEINLRMAEIEAERRTLAENNDASYEDILRHFLPGASSDPEKLAKQLRDEAELDVKTDLIAQHLVTEASVTFGRTEYESIVAEYLAQGASRELIEARFPYEEYLKSAPGEFWTKQILEYFRPKFEVVKV
ncbi:MAG: hypothetical protein IJL08_07330 [Oscillospiraceae bacterium]|nr:hypothetical protein [Oscillospiraceae bacterium]